jgi:hypothetical protein
MIRKLLFLASLLSLSGFAFGQGVAVPPSTAFKVVNGITQPFSGATITVCAANTSGIPCSPVLTGALFFDTGLTQPKPNPFQADANGNYAFAISPGTYTITITGTGFAGYSYQMTSPGTGSGGGGGGGSTNVFANGAVLGPLTFATLPASAANGTVAIVSDGTAGPACSAGGAGAIAFRVAGAWTCDSPISGYLGAFTVATLPAASAHTSQLVRVTDGTSAADCTAGSGATSALCLSNGASWVAVGGSAAFGALSGGINTTAAMQVGSGASMTPTGSGIITATSVQTPINTQTVNYQLVLTDAGGLVRMNLAGANTLTVPADGTTNFPVGSAITIRQVGAGQTTIVAAGGVTISTPSSLVVRVQNASVEVIKVAANTWDLIGDTQ